MERDEGPLQKLWAQYKVRADVDLLKQYIRAFNVHCHRTVQRPPPLSATPSLNLSHDGHGPSLASDSLPADFLAHVSEHLATYETRDFGSGDYISCLSDVDSILQCVSSLSKRLANIPLISASTVVDHLIAVMQLILGKVSADCDAAADPQALPRYKALVVGALQLVEHLYDPYGLWRHYVQGHHIEPRGCKHSPASLHDVVIPFIYESFHLVPRLDDSIQCALLHVCGAVLCGSKRNALKFISPITLVVFTKLLSDVGNHSPDHEADVSSQLLFKCLTKMAQVLHNCNPEERQIEVSMIMEALLQSAKALSHHLPSPGPQIQLIKMLGCLQTMLVCPDKTAMQMACASINVFKELVYILNHAPSGHVPDESEGLSWDELDGQASSLPVNRQRTPSYAAVMSDDAHSLVSTVMSLMGVLMSGSLVMEQHFQDQVGREQLVGCLRQLGCPRRELLQLLLDLAVEEHSTVTMRSSQRAPAAAPSKLLRNVNVLLVLVEWLPSVSAAPLPVNAAGAAADSGSAAADDDSGSAQSWLSAHILALATASTASRAMCCKCGVVRGVTRLLDAHRSELSFSSVANLLSLLESLCSLSVTADELKQIIGLMRPEHDGKQGVYTSRLMVMLSNVAKADTSKCARQYFTFPSNGSAIDIPTVRQWPAGGFSFHAWIRLDAAFQSQQSRRMLYTFYTEAGSGFEACVTASGSLMVSTCLKNEYCAASIDGSALLNGRWHCVDVVYAVPRLPLLKSLGSGKLQVSVYIDGKLRETCQMKAPPLTESYQHCRLGNTSTSSLSTLRVQLQPLSSHEAASRRRLVAVESAILSVVRRGRTGSSSCTVQELPAGEQNIAYGLPTSLRGDVSYACLFGEALQEAQVLLLHDKGCNGLAMSDGEDGEMAELLDKMMLYYNAKVCTSTTCHDLSATSLNQSSLNGHLVQVELCSTHGIKDVVNSIGGVRVLLPLLEQADKAPPAQVPVGQPMSTSDFIPEDSLSIGDDWEFLFEKRSFYTDVNLHQSHVASFFVLLQNMIKDSDINQEELLRSGTLAVVGVLLQKMKQDVMDVRVLMAMQLLVEAVGPAHQSLLHTIYHTILLDFRIWNRTSFAVRIGHIQYIATITRSDRKYFRKHFGVQAVLDVIRTFYSGSAKNPDVSEDDLKALRFKLLGIIKFYVGRDILFEELSSLLNFVASVEDTEVVSEVLDLLIELLDSKQTSDQIFLLMFERTMADLLFALLVPKDEPITIKEKVLRIVKRLLKSDKVYDRNKSRLRLDGAGGMAGLVSFLHGSPLSLPMIRILLDIMCLPDAKNPNYKGIMSVLSLVHLMPLSAKVEVSKWLMELVFGNPAAPRQLSAQPGWQEALVKLLQADTVPADAAAAAATDDGQLDAVPVFTASELQELASSAPTAGATQLFMTSVDDDLGSDSFTMVDSQPPSPFPSRSRLADATLSAPATPMETSRSSMTHLPAVPSPLAFVSGSPSLGGDSKGEGAFAAFASDSASSGASLASLGAGAAGQRQRSRAEHGSSFVETGGELDELVDNMTSLLFTLLWKGVEKGSPNCWKERQLVFANIDLLHDHGRLLASHGAFKRTLLEMMLQACQMDLSDAGEDMSSSSMSSSQLLLRGVRPRSAVPADVLGAESALELVKLAKEFTSDAEHVSPDRFSEKLLDELSVILDKLSVWHPTTGWQQLAQMGLSLLLQFAAQEDMHLCSLAATKLHVLLHDNAIGTHDSAELFYMLATLDAILAPWARECHENYSFLFPVLRSLLEKHAQLLEVSERLLLRPALSGNPNALEDYRSYILSPEWRSFIDDKILQSSRQYVLVTHKHMEAEMSNLRLDVHQLYMDAVHRRNRDKTESSLAFRSEIIEPFIQKMASERRRYQLLQARQRSSLSATLARWRHDAAFFSGERGAWFDGNVRPQYWKISHEENASRMRPKMVPNLHYDQHIDASRLRDNAGDDTPGTGTDMIDSSLLKKATAGASMDETDDEDINLPLQTGTASGSPHANRGAVVEAGAAEERVVLAVDCELITVMRVIPGRLELTTTHLYFFDTRGVRDDAQGVEDLKWPLTMLREVNLRRYNLRRTALEFFLIDQTNYMFNFDKKTQKEVFAAILRRRPPNLIYYNTRRPEEILRLSGLTERWVRREITNFDYLMQLNTIAGRTYNDLCQYPVFPWILSDYASQQLDLDNPAVFRDLSKPIGILNPKNEEEIREKYENFEDPFGVIKKFHYGTHYSNPAGVMHFLVRQEPFTELHIELQGNRFDAADRQFYSLPASWNALINSMNDVKELVPELFYLPEVLLNTNNFDLGKLQGSEQRVHDVVLPPWAESADDFVYKHRKALESEYVSAHLHEWIDLIFGYKQKGEEAVKAANVFYYCTYEGAVDLDKIDNPIERKATEGMINNFGQVPCQLLKEPHPKQKTFEEAVEMALRADRPISIVHFLKDYKCFFADVSSPGDPIVFAFIPNYQSKTIFQVGSSSTLITVSESGVVGMHGWLPYSKNLLNFFTFEKDESVSNLKAQKRLPQPFTPGLKVEPKLFAVSGDGKLLLSCGFWDNSVCVYSLAKQKTVAHIAAHLDVVTCLATDNAGTTLITGSRDMTCKLWQITMQGGTSVGMSRKPLQTLYGHETEVLCVAVSMELDAAVSGSKDGTVLVHSAHRGVFIRTLRPGATVGMALSVDLLALSDSGHVVVYCEMAAGGHASSTSGATTKIRAILQSYSINGRLLASETIAGSSECLLSHLCLCQDRVVHGDRQETLIVREIFNLKVEAAIQLRLPVRCVAAAPGQSHLVAGIDDGKLIFVGRHRPAEIRPPFK